MPTFWLCRFSLHSAAGLSLGLTHTPYREIQTFLLLSLLQSGLGGCDIFQIGNLRKAVTSLRPALYASQLEERNAWSFISTFLLGCW